MNAAEKVALAAAGSGVGGWLLENAIFGRRYSANLPGVPFLPVYAAGGAAVALLEPYVRSENILTRALVYGATLTVIEGVSGLADRARGRRTWDYGGEVIDIPHALAWTALALGLERLL